MTPSYYEPVVSDVPALVLSGDLDPVTPPAWGESVVKTLKNGRHVTVPGTGHGVIGTACGQKLIQELSRRRVGRIAGRLVRALDQETTVLRDAGGDPTAVQRDLAQPTLLAVRHP